MIKKNKIFKIILISISVFAASFFGALIYKRKDILNLSKLSTISPPHAYIVQSGSMEPTLKTGSIVISQPKSIYAPSDVITFKKSINSDSLITHRIMNRNFSEGIENPPIYQTSGDANEDFDNGQVTQEQVIGKVILTIPYLGYLADFAQKPYGFILFVIVPATIIIYEELKRTIKEIYKYLTVKSEKVKTKRSSNFCSKLRKGSVVIPVLGTFFVLTGLASAYFSDNEKTSDNIFQAGTWGSQIAETLVINEFLWNSSCTPNSETKFWIELYNGYSNPVNIKNWRFKDANNETVQISNAEYVINPGEYVLVVKSSSTFSSCYTKSADVRELNLGGNPDFTPSNTGGTIYLEKPSETINGDFEVVDTIVYGPATSLDTNTDQSIGRHPNGTDTTLGCDFNESDFTVYDIEHKSPGVFNQ